MILMSINAFMQLPDEEKFETLRHVCKGDIQLINIEQIALEMGDLQ